MALVDIMNPTSTFLLLVFFNTNSCFSFLMLRCLQNLNLAFYLQNATEDNLGTNRISTAIFYVIINQ